MNEATIERVAKHLASSNGDPAAWGAYAHQAMEVIDLAGDQWEPIETAPKDGSAIDLWHHDFGRIPDHYWGMPTHECGEEGSYCDSDWHRSAEGWVDGSHNEFAFDADEFTHWRPLSKPPKT